jgi:hypothetical protein
MVLTYLLTYEINCSGQEAQRVERILGTVLRKQTMAKYDNLSSANILAQNATSERDRLVVHLFTEMAEKNRQLEARLDHAILLLTELKAKDGDQLLDFDERVLNVLDVRSGSARAALQLEDTDVQRWMMSAIEENSGEAFGHIEAEIEEKLEGFIETCAFTEAVEEAVRDGLSRAVEEALEGLLHDAIIDAVGDAEDIVRKGLRSIL